MLKYYFKTIQNQEGSYTGMVHGQPDIFAKGSTLDELHENITAVLRSNFIFRIEFSIAPIPMPVALPEPEQGDATTIYIPINLGLSDSFKILIWNRMHQAKISKTELAAALGIMHVQADRLLQIGTRTGIDLIERAISAVNCDVEIILKGSK